MSVIADTSPVVADDRLARRNAIVLSAAQALAGGNNTVIAATAGIIGTMLAPDKGLATLPVSVMVIGIWFGTLPLGYITRNHGRRFALQTGSVVGTLGGLVSCAAVLIGSFELFLVGTFGCGFYSAAHNSYRFAVCDTASDAYKPKGISMVLAGGTLAGFIGSGTVIVTKDLWVPHLFAATFVAQAVLAALAGLVLTRLKSPPPVPHAEREAGRPLSEIAQNPLFIVAVACGVVSYVVMNLLMTSAPIAMVECGHSVTVSTLGIQWHVLGMYAPSFITGHLIARFGVFKVISVGLGLLLLSGAVGIAGLSAAHFWISLTLLGVGWNFAFIGATTLVTLCHRPEEHSKVQSFNDFLIFGTMALGSFASGKLMATVGWEWVNIAAFVPVLVVVLLLGWLKLQRRGLPV
ncbi:MFS transporter [Rhodoplanes sp. Z2-YC6860]|uniref:MFS transporter n=1 Tax=Rhodoplanes sp. Z2-YC6860 TaxID=674703 RepID=UPI00078EB76E|nr:MFS transporter [Rhodoplanes sp. Z2-YC6860]AMN42190.1 major facilitator superfamily protein [Rhodoplanes sp. Z2-YC6860]